jgi:hypothetical protein
MKRMLIGICLAICLVCGVVEVRADCSGIDDPYLKAKCEVEGQKASGLSRWGYSGAEHDQECRSTQGRRVVSRQGALGLLKRGITMILAV